MGILDDEHDRMFRSDNLRPVDDACKGEFPDRMSRVRTVADMNGAKFVGYASPALRRSDELVEEAPNVVRLHRSIITPEWRSRMLAEPAEWPGGIGEEPVFGEAG